METRNGGYAGQAAALQALADELAASDPDDVGRVAAVAGQARQLGDELLTDAAIRGRDLGLPIRVVAEPSGMSVAALSRRIRATDPRSRA